MAEQLSLVADNSVVLVPDDVWRARAALEEFLYWRGHTLATAEIAIDTETAGLGWDDEVRLVQIGDSDNGFAINVAQPEGVELVRESLSLHRGQLVFHNAGFDLHALERIGIDVEPLWSRVVDTYILAHVQDPSRLNGLDPLVASILGDDDSGYKKQFRASMRKNKWTWATVPVWALTSYGVNDAIKTHRLYSYFCDTLSEQEWDVVERETAVARAAWEVERHGMRLDTGYAYFMKGKWTSDLELDREWFAMKGIANPNANRAIAAALKEDGWEPDEFTPTGEVKLDKKVLEAFNGDNEIVSRLLEHKRKGKWLAAYVDNCLEQVDDRGYVHASYNTLGAKTGRMSCSNPPLQQLPKGGGGEIRRLFIASSGNVIASVDYSAIEFRLAGAMSGDRRIIEVYLEGGDPYQDVADDLGLTRPEAKLLQLQTLYGARPKRISLTMGFPYKKAKRVYDGFWSMYPTLSDWVDAMTAQAEAGLPIYSMWGRTLRPHAPYAAANAKIQGTAAEVLKEGLLRLEQENLLQYVCAIVHDECVLDVPELAAEEITSNVAHILEDKRFAVPLVAEGSIYGESWGAGYE